MQNDDDVLVVENEPAQQKSSDRHYDASILLGALQAMRADRSERVRDLPRELNLGVDSGDDLNTEIVAPHSTFEIVQVPGKLLQFFEYRHDWREVLTDGRAQSLFPVCTGFAVDDDQTTESASRVERLSHGLNHRRSADRHHFRCPLPLDKGRD